MNNLWKMSEGKGSKEKMGTHYSFGFLIDHEKDIIYVSGSSNGTLECTGEYVLNVLRDGGAEGLLTAMVDDDLERIDHMESNIFTVASDEQWQEWTFSDWIYLYKQQTGFLLVCYPAHQQDIKGNLNILGKNPYGGVYGISILLEVPVNGTETVMDVWHRTRDLKRVGRYLTLYK